MRFCSRKSAMAADGSCESSCSPAVDQTIPGLRKALHACSKAVESGDLSISSRAAEELALYLHSVSELVLSDQEDEDLKRKAFEVLSEIHGYLCASTDEAFVDAISGFLPKEVSKLSIASEKCLRIAERIIDKLIEVCGARFMLPILAGAFAYPDEEAHNPKYFAPLLHGISAAFLSIGRRQFENIKTALPVILTSLEDISRDPNVETADLILPFQRTLSVATSIRNISEGNMHDKLRALLTLFILQILVRILHF
uniref:ARM repeat superfamily protein n=1 Tax=Kalanchoe fedtschenkoi TaxID=63787 RepID=A0A7N0USX8_KALFE